MNNNRLNNFKEIIKKVFLIAIVPMIVPLLAFIIGGLINNFLNQLGFKSNINSLEIGNILKTINPFLFLIVGCVLAPIVEEYIFRFPIVKFTIKQLFFSVAIYFIFKSFSNKVFILNPILTNINFKSLAIGIIFFIFSIILKIKSLDISIPDKFKNPYIVISTLLFGFLHTYDLITFDELFSVQILFLFTLTLPQIFIGFYLVFLTKRFNFKYAVWAHLINNLRTFLIMYFTYKL